MLIQEISGQINPLHKKLIFVNSIMNENKLISVESPYLFNLVDWHPWNEETFALSL
ncbi:MAG: thioredoxin domain-containing protein [Bacteroidota bacterium]|nr:thioredoxin domain-containing protein [Bacteroidota bacterium]